MAVTLVLPKFRLCGKKHRLLIFMKRIQNGKTVVELQFIATSMGILIPVLAGKLIIFIQPHLVVPIIYPIYSPFNGRIT